LLDAKLLVDLGQPCCVDACVHGMLSTATP
jgi:hypothetical protein